jgi:hypothetical protein
MRTLELVQCRIACSEGEQIQPRRPRSREIVRGRRSRTEVGHRGRHAEGSSSRRLLGPCATQGLRADGCEPGARGADGRDSRRVPRRARSGSARRDRDLRTSADATRRGLPSGDADLEVGASPRKDVPPRSAVGVALSYIRRNFRSYMTFLRDARCPSTTTGARTSSGARY